MKNNFETNRLLLQELNLEDAPFIYQLLNTEGWKKFIGDRNILTLQDAEKYISNVINNPNCNYWVVREKTHEVSIGIITFIKRDYLEHPDLGFAFLPAYAGEGYALESSKIVLDKLMNTGCYPMLFATTVKENCPSIRLIQKLGFKLMNETKKQQELLLVYGIAFDQWAIDDIVSKFYSAFANTHQPPDWKLLEGLSHPQIQISKCYNQELEIYDLKSFIVPRKELLSNNTLLRFEEQELSSETKVEKNIAQRFSSYKKTGILHQQPFETFGKKMFQFSKTKQGWKIISLIWEDCPMD
jgi:RimJ/RimL family protein N-acetyltransferase